eukprot:CAMPEP_0197490130 /NCGR_PEP_ID=MMETSP1311-20131121/4755_1 /TAXON_ID=464262 /ORGANISM="Genus nov. species nov., Strain RCC856" /LENGTH=227 /DNA_ID=CAMNT_0043034591 /DNA_START=90 /DNA_END=769 /DNA_ORIENTATION=+
MDLKQGVTAHLGSGEDGLEEHVGDSVWVNVGGWASVLQVSLALDLNLSWDANGGTSVSDSGPEGTDVAGLVESRQSLLVSDAVLGDVLVVSLRQELDGVVDGLGSTVVSHALGREVGVGTSSVPVSLDRLWIKGAHDAHVLAQSVEEPSGDHHGVSELERADRANLVLPLARHDLRVDSADLNTGLDARVQVGLGERSSVDGLVTDSAVEWALGGWVAALWPSEDSS